MCAKPIFLVISILSLIVCLPLVAFAQGTERQTIVCAIGDSHFEPGSALLRFIRAELGPEYTVLARGRRGWTTRRWISSGDFNETCRGADVVLISLGGNDIHLGHSWQTVKNNIQNLARHFTVPWIHIVVPRFYEPRPQLGRDGIHLTPTGAREYAKIISENILRVLLV